MMPSLYRRLLAVVFLLSFTAAASAQPLQWFWWKSEPSLALSPEQSSQIDAIFQEGIGRLMQQKDELDRLETKLSRLIASSSDEAQVTQQIDRVEAVRSTLNKTRTLMLLHMRQVLKPDQRLKLEALRDRRVQAQQHANKPAPSSETGKGGDGARKRSN
jgi:Spy/CpxP family protein refolding chaperone